MFCNDCTPTHVTQHVPLENGCEKILHAEKQEKALAHSLLFPQINNYYLNFKIQLYVFSININVVLGDVILPLRRRDLHSGFCNNHLQVRFRNLSLLLFSFLRRGGGGGGVL